ncbi:MAG: lactonase family protein [Clostridia bacterium]|nr:lactonase family protein [Clostridia bacterium]
MAKYDLYIGSFKKGEGAAVLKCIFDDDSGKIVEADRIDTVRPSYLSISDDKKTLFAILEANEIDGVYGGGVSSINVSKEKMELISSQSTHSKGPSHLCIHDGKLIASIYGEGALVQFDIEPDNTIKPISNLIKLHGCGPDKERQTQPHPHHVCLTPDGTHIAMCDLGLDKIFMYPYDKHNGISLGAREIPCPSGSGPRHLIFSNDSRFMYVLTEMGSTVLVFSYNKNADAKLIQEISCLPDDWKGENTAAAIRISKDGKELIASNRGHDSLALFFINEEGTLSSKGYIPTQLWPRDFDYAPSGNWLLCANQNSNTIVVYKKDTSNSYIPHSVMETDIMPCCIVWGNKIG